MNPKELKVRIWEDERLETYANRQNEYHEFLKNGGHLMIGVMTFIRAVHEVFLKYDDVMTMEGWVQPTVNRVAVMLRAERRNNVFRSEITIVGAAEMSAPTLHM